MTCGGFKDLPRNTASAILLRDNPFDIAKNPYEYDHTSMIYKFVEKRSSAGAFKSKIMPNQ